ncbi:alpha/beta hydrolase [Brachyspira intermedia]|uniref:alpha/beta hydrolase n=1 Tax=Brachyspira intermedia TaxID=84377 RepID=UPI003003C351
MIKTFLKRAVLMSVYMLFPISTIMAQNNTLKWDKTFKKSDKVTVKKVSFYNRLGINIVADLYTPKDINTNQKYKALVIGGPYGAVKEQAAGVYAQSMAERGFVTIAFDPSYNGESGGSPHYTASPEAFAEDFSVAVDFLGTLNYVDRNEIGAIGICGSGSFVLSAAQIDTRIKAIATASMYDMGRVARQGLYDSVSYEDRKKMIDDISMQRWNEYEGGEKKYQIGTPETIDENSPDIVKEFYSYYRTERGFHPRATTTMSIISTVSLMNYYPLEQIDFISPRPILFIAGEKAHSRYFSEDAYEKAKEPKELIIIPNANHVDLYDRTDLIPFDKLADFFNQNLTNKN